jgi:hypothetical protein
MPRKQYYYAIQLIHRKGGVDVNTTEHHKQREKAFNRLDYLMMKFGAAERSYWVGILESVAARRNFKSVQVTTTRNEDGRTFIRVSKIEGRTP